MAPEIRIAGFPLKDETDKIINVGIEIHKILGHGFLEIVYKDAFEFEFKKRNHLYEREKMYSISYKEVILPHKEEIADEDYAQTINYLKCSGCKVGLILNFGRIKLDIKRVSINLILRVFRAFVAY